MTYTQKVTIGGADMKCNKCGTDDRTPSGGCRQCRREVSNRYREANPEKIKEANRKSYLKELAGGGTRLAKWKQENPDLAKAQGAARYAKHGEKMRAANAEWIAANKERRDAQLKAWSAANKDKNKAKFQEAYKADPEKFKAIAAKWRGENPEKVREIVKKSRLANPESVRIHHANRRARKKAVGGRLSRGLAKKLFTLQKGVCPCCKQPLGSDAQLDHKMPIALGGTNTDDNIQLLRKRCNIQKGAKHPVDFMQSRGFLL